MGDMWWQSFFVHIFQIILWTGELICTWRIRYITFVIRLLGILVIIISLLRQLVLQVLWCELRPESRVLGAKFTLHHRILSKRSPIRGLKSRYRKLRALLEDWIVPRPPGFWSFFKLIFSAYTIDSRNVVLNWSHGRASSIGWCFV